MTAYVFGKPVVATRVGCLPEYIQDGVTGIIIDPGDENQLAEAMIRLLSNNDLRHQMGKNAAKWVDEELGWERIAAQTLKAYERAIELNDCRR